MLFHLSFFKLFSYRRCSSQNFFMNDCRKHKRKSLHHFMSCQHLIKVRYHALELYNASKLDRASGSHLGARVSTPFFLRYHTPPLHTACKHVKIRTPRTCECNRTLRMASNVPDLSATTIDKHVTYREPIVQKEY